MDKTALVIRQFEKISKQKVFAIRPLDDEHPELFLLNYSYLVQASDTPSAELLFARRMHEFYFYQQAVSKRLLLPCPNLLFYLPKGNLKAEDYIDGVSYGERASEEEAFKVIDALALLHQYHLEKQTFDPFEHFYHYKKLAENALPASFEDSLLKKARIIYDSSSHALCHNDIKRRHVLFHDDKAFLLDFSACGENAPIFDLVSFFLDADLSPELIRLCMDRYYKVAGGRSYLYQEVFDAMSFVCAFDYYHYAALSKTSVRPLYAALAKKRKERCLRLFEETLG